MEDLDSKLKEQQLDQLATIRKSFAVVTAVSCYFVMHLNSTIVVRFIA